MPDLIYSENSARQRESGSPRVILKINVRENLDKTWLCSPPSNYTSLPGDSIHVWPSNTVYPTCDKHFVPDQCNDFMPHFVPYNISEDNFKNFINGNALVKNFKAMVDNRIFNTSEAKVPGKTFNQIDSISRKGLSENLINDSIIESNVEFLSGILSTWDDSSKGELKEKFSIIHHSLKLASASNLRQRNILCSIFTLNKLALRQDILDKFDGDSNTKDMLLGTCLGVPTVFGPLPESFFQRINANAANAKEIVLYPKSKNFNLKNNSSFNAYKSNPSFKRPRGGSNFYDNKRGRYVISTQVNTPTPSFSNSGNSSFLPNYKGKAPFRNNSASRGRGFQRRK